MFLPFSNAIDLDDDICKRIPIKLQLCVCMFYGLNK